MNDQLVLLDDDEGRKEEPLPAAAEHPWRLDEHTREIGRRGVARARHALHRAAARAA